MTYNNFTMGKENPFFGGEMLQEYRMMINVPLNYLPFCSCFLPFFFLYVQINSRNTDTYRFKEDMLTEISTRKISSLEDERQYYCQLMSSIDSILNKRSSFFL